MKKWVNVFAVLLSVFGLAACQSQSSVQGAPASLEGEWKVVQINGPAPVLQGKFAPTLVIDEAEGRVSGFDGCNQFFGHLEIEGNHSIKVGPLGGTLKACMNDESRLQSSAYLMLMQQASSYAVDAHSLVLYGPLGSPLVNFAR